MMLFHCSNEIKQEKRNAKKIHIVPKTHLISVFYFNEIEKNTLYKSGEIRHAWIRIFYD